SFIISPRLQVLGVIPAPEEAHAHAVLAILEKIAHPARMPPILSHAPVLIIPHVFEPELCQALIAGYRAESREASGFMRDIGGKTVEVRDPEHKMRRDWVMDEEKNEWIGTIQSRFKKRVVPEIRKAYQFEA